MGGSVATVAHQAGIDIAIAMKSRTTGCQSVEIPRCTEEVGDEGPRRSESGKRFVHRLVRVLGILQTLHARFAPVEHPLGWHGTVEWRGSRSNVAASLSVLSLDFTTMASLVCSINL